MKRFLILTAILMMGCPSSQHKIIPLRLLDSIELNTVIPNLNFPSRIDSSSKLFHSMVLENNRWDDLAELELNLIFSPNESDRRISNKYYKTSWENEGYHLILAHTPAFFTFLMIVDEKGKVHDAISATHYMPGPVCCHNDVRKMKKTSAWEFEFEEIYGIAIDRLDSCDKTTNVDRYLINHMNYFEHVSRNSTTLRTKELCH